MALPTPVEWDIITARVNAARAQFKSPSNSQGFLTLILRQYFPELGDDVLETITDGPGDSGADAIHIVETGDVARIYIFQCKYRDSVLSASKTINVDEALKIIQFLRDVHAKSPHLSSSSNFRVRQAVASIWSLYERGLQCFYDIVFCSNDQGLAKGAASILDGFKAEYTHVAYTHYGPKDFIRDSAIKRSRSEAGQLHVVGREVFDRSDGDVRGLIASVDAGSYVSLITNAQDGSVKRHLFEDNLRVFLGSNVGYNPAIIESASSPENHLFWYLNNGVTITCRKFSYNKGVVSPIIKLEDFQIVNGAQTSHSLVEAKAKNAQALQQVILMVRVYETERADIAERVAVATNSQARIQDRDLRSNSEVLKKLEASFASRDYYFERKRNMYSDKPATQRLDALKLGQIIMSYHLREPDRARTESDSIFGNRFNAIFREEYDMDDLVRVIKLYGKIEWLREDFVTRFGDQIENSGDYQYLIYGHWFILYAARLLLNHSNEPVPDGEAAGKLVERAIEVVARACNQNKQVAHYQMFRSPKTKEKIMAEISGKQLELFLS